MRRNPRRKTQSLGKAFNTLWVRPFGGSTIPFYLKGLGADLEAERQPRFAAGAANCDLVEGRQRSNGRGLVEVHRDYNRPNAGELADKLGLASQNF